jgi:hypothetical protein
VELLLPRKVFAQANGLDVAELLHRAKHLAAILYRHKLRRCLRSLALLYGYSYKHRGAPVAPVLTRSTGALP